MVITDLKQFFTPQAVVQRLRGLPPLKTTVLDTFYKRKVNHPMAKVGRDDIVKNGTPGPLILRGAPSLALEGPGIALAEYEPFEGAFHRTMTAADVNNLMTFDRQSITARLAAVDDDLRRKCRATAEAIAAVSMTGTISWPVQLENGAHETYQVTFGSPLTHAPDKLWSAADATVKHVFEDLQAMEEAIEEEGYGGEVRFWASKTAFSQLMSLAEGYQDNPKAKLKIDVSVKAKTIFIGGYQITRMAEKYTHPTSGSAVAKVEDGKIMAYADDAVHTMFYCALDDLDAKLRPLPYFSKPVKTDDPSGVKIIGRSKPFPAPVPKAICWATVLS